MPIFYAASLVVVIAYLVASFECARARSSLLLRHSELEVLLLGVAPALAVAAFLCTALSSPAPLEALRAALFLASVPAGLVLLEVFGRDTRGPILGALPERLSSGLVTVLLPFVAITASLGLAYAATAVYFSLA